MDVKVENININMNMNNDDMMKEQLDDVDEMVAIPEASCSRFVRRRHLLTIRDKLEMLKKIDNGVSVSRLQKEYGVGKSTIYDIKSRRDKLYRFIGELHTTNQIAKRKTLRGPNNIDLDKFLYEWFRECINNNVSVSGSMIIEKAKSLHEDLKIEGECDYSAGWLYRFKNRHGIRYLNISGEQVLVNPEPVDDLLSICNTDDVKVKKGNMRKRGRKSYAENADTSEYDPLVMEDGAKPIEFVSSFENHNDELNDGHSKISMSEAILCCEKLLNFMEHWAPATDTEILQIYRLKDKLKKGKRDSQKHKRKNAIPKATSSTTA